jgi:16S rRNA (guanine527-N7)-methyltransferase
VIKPVKDSRIDNHSEAIPAPDRIPFQRFHSVKPSRPYLEKLVVERGVALDQTAFDRLWAYHRMLREANERLNLTRIHNFENMVIKHYVDSLLVLRFVDPAAPLLDMGSGAGFPGIPIKIARPDLEMILAEPRGARVGFLREVIRELGLERIEVVASKVGPRFDRPFASVVTRAVASIPLTLERIEPRLEPGGAAIFMKGPACDDEIEAADRDFSGRFLLESDRAYAIPGTPHERRLVVYRKSMDPQVNKKYSYRIHDSVASEVESETDEDDRVEPFEREAEALRLGSDRVVEIATESNPYFQMCADALTSRGIRRGGKAIVAGKRIVTEVLEQFPERVAAWVGGPDDPPPPRSGPAWLRVRKSLFERLDTVGTHSPLLLIDVPQRTIWDGYAPWPAGCTLFVPFQDPENVGGVIRSAAAFGVARVVLMREAANPFLPRAIRASGPAVLRVELCDGPSIRELESTNVPLIALATEGPELESEPWPDRFGLVVGVEGPGLPDRFRSGARRRIAIEPGIESLNAAASTAIALYSWSKSKKASNI